MTSNTRTLSLRSMLLALALILVYSVACQSPTESKKDGFYQFIVECFVIMVDSVTWTDSCVTVDSVWVPQP